MKTVNRQKMKQWISISTATLCISLVSVQSIANSSTGPYTDYAKVTDVSPIYEAVAIRRPHRECHTEERVVRNNRHHSYTPNILGALIGGAIGNELGHNKSNKRVGAVAGAILGGSIASDLNRSNRHQGHHTKTKKVCSTSHTIRHKKN